MTKTRFLSLTIVIIAIVAIFSAFAAIPASAAEGYSGTPAESVPKIDSTNYHLYGLTASDWQTYDGYYAITTAEEFYKWAAAKNNHGNAALFADIVINTVNVHTADPASLIPFDGILGDFGNTFDGRGHSISGIYMNSQCKASYSLALPPAW